MSEATATIGHNSLLAIYAEQNAALPGYLLTEHETLIARAAELKGEFDGSPQSIDDDEGRLDVWEGDRHTEQLAWDKMLGQIVNLMHPKVRESRAHYPMLTASEWAFRNGRWDFPEPSPCDEWPKEVFDDSDLPF